MSPLPSSSGSSPAPRWKHWAGFSALTVVLALVMMRAPIPLDVEPDISYRSLLYETLRLGHTWGEALVTTDGPLAAVQAPVYASGSVWMAMSWQIGGNLLLAAVLVGAAWRLPWSQRRWALGFLAASLARAPTIAPWVALILLGWILICRREATPLFVLVSASIVGFLGLSSLGHLLLGGFAIGLTLATVRPLRSKLVALAGFITAIVVGWIALGQPVHGLGLWFGRAFPVLWETSPLLRYHDATPPLKVWAAAASLALAMTLLFFLRPAGRRIFIVPGIFLAGSCGLAWKAIVLQPFGLPGVFFATLIAAAFLLRQAGAKLAGAVLIAALASAGLLRWQPLILVDGLGHFNRQLILNLQSLSALPKLRSTLHEQVKQAGGMYGLPRIKAAVGGATVDVIGGRPGQAILNGLNLRPRPAALGALVRSPLIAGLNRLALSRSDAPEFILQRFQPANGIVPALEDAAAQLELYRSYEFVLEEDGFTLWKRRIPPAGSTALPLVGAGELSFGETLALPAHEADTGYWLELDLHANWLGRLWSCVDEVSEPGLLAHDDAGHALHYDLSTAVTPRGFLVEPFLRGDADFLRLQTGTGLPRISTVTVVPPASGSWLWNKRINYRLYAVPGLKLAGHQLSGNALDRYRLFNRVPIATTCLFPINVLPSELGTLIAFAHPPSSIEFAVTGQDRHVRGEFGILNGAYQGKNVTDGVDFSIEFITGDGTRLTLYHRHLDPLSVPDDRGLQSFDAAWPAGQAGRLILRTYNPPWRNQAWDWSYWRSITIE